MKTRLNPPSIAAHRKSSTFLEINGIVYKSNQRKLEKTTMSSKYSLRKTSKTSLSYRRLIVRGENFMLDANGKNLVRVQSNTNAMVPDSIANRKRIDIGKITFVKKSNDTYERTDFHKSRYHLNVAKQRSIQMLTNRLVKTNVPCPIYRKLGKCAAFVRGKCAKLHDKKLVDVCPRLFSCNQFLLIFYLIELRHFSLRKLYAFFPDSSREIVTKIPVYCLMIQHCPKCRLVDSTYRECVQRLIAPIYIKRSTIKRRFA